MTIEKPLKIMLVGWLLSAILAGGYAINTYIHREPLLSIEENISELIAKCEADENIRQNDRLEKNGQKSRFVAVCDRDAVVYMQGIKRDKTLGISSDKEHGYQPSYEVYNIVEGTSFALCVLFSLPWLWYFFLARVRELREALTGRR